MELIKRFEGCRLAPYVCPAGRWTCGWGSTGIDVIPGQAWTQPYADYRLEQDAIKASLDAVRLCPGLTGTQIDAIADFVYNLGSGRLRSSTLRRKFNAGRIDEAKTELMKWVFGGGKKLLGLVLRRKAEADLL